MITPAEILNSIIDPLEVTTEWNGDTFDVVIYIEGDYKHAWQAEEAVERYKVALRAAGLKVAE